jgi:PAS domain S-box-containing protein
MPPPPEPSHEARLEAVLESVSDGFFALDPDWRFVVFNRAAEEFFGNSRDRVLGRVIWDLVPHRRGTPFGVACRAAMENGASTSFETESTVRPGRVVELRVVPMTGGGVAVTLTDITRRKAAEARQRLLVNELNTSTCWWRRTGPGPG